jgi:plasmid stabilization system protein ParE
MEWRYFGDHWFYHRYRGIAKDAIAVARANPWGGVLGFHRMPRPGSSVVEIRYHFRVQSDLNGAMAFYREASGSLADDFYDEFFAGIHKVRDHPKIGHFDPCGLRRCNLEKFPFHFLDDIQPGYIRVWVLRHDKRQPGFGTKRFK